MCLLIPAEISALLTSLAGVVCETGVVICGSRGASCVGCDSPRSGIAGMRNSERDIATMSRRIITVNVEDCCRGTQFTVPVMLLGSKIVAPSQAFLLHVREHLRPAGFEKSN